MVQKVKLKREKCTFDVEEKGNCDKCMNDGGCKECGGPFIRCIECGKVKANAEMCSRQPYCKDCY